METVKTVFDPELNAHLATIRPPLAAVDITIQADKFDTRDDLNELFVYNFDIDSNCIEFAFGEKVQHSDDKTYVTYTTNPAIHIPPFRIQIMHQEQAADMSKYGFTVSYQLRY